jgi:hypothetical protein
MEQSHSEVHIRSDSQEFPSFMKPYCSFELTTRSYREPHEFNPQISTAFS